MKESCWLCWLDPSLKSETIWRLVCSNHLLVPPRDVLRSPASIKERKGLTRGRDEKGEHCIFHHISILKMKTKMDSELQKNKNLKDWQIQNRSVQVSFIPLIPCYAYAWFAFYKTVGQYQILRWFEISVMSSFSSFASLLVPLKLRDLSSKQIQIQTDQQGCTHAEDHHRTLAASIWVDNYWKSR